ncbi:hypothetical protein [Persephonella sp.]
MVKILTAVLFISSVVFANTLVLTDGRYATYIQEEEFMLAEGENIIGPISLLPIAVPDAVKVYGDRETVKSFILENLYKNWKKNLLGKFITLEGEGRIIRGTVVSIDDKYITINSKKGFVVTTLPKFPSRVSSALRWEELFSPQLTLMVNSEEAKSQVFRVRYPIEGVSWSISYIVDIKNGIKTVEGYVVIRNNTAVDFRNINISIKGRLNKEFKQVSLPPYTEKKILYLKKNFTNLEELSLLPEGAVYIYKNGVFVRKTNIKNISR